MFKKCSILYFGLLVLALAQSPLIKADFICGNYSNDGIVSTGGLQRLIIKEELSNNGTIESSEALYIECGNLTGAGKIKAPKIQIFARQFNFTGSIECSEECTIITEKPINRIKNNFKKLGKGKFEFKIDPQFELPSEKPVNFLPSWWKTVLKNYEKNIENGCAICRICIQMTVSRKDKNSDQWNLIKDQYRKLRSFFDVGIRFSKNPMIELRNQLKSFPYEEIEHGQLTGISLNTSVNVFRGEDLHTDFDLDQEPGNIMIGIFIIFDPNQRLFNSFFGNLNVTASQAIDLYFDLETLANDKRLNQFLDAQFFVAS